MISIRLTGTKEECEAFAEMLSGMFSMSASPFTFNRSGSSGRIYIEIPREEFMGSVDSLPGEDSEEIHICHEPYCDTCYNCARNGRCRWEP